MMPAMSSCVSRATGARRVGDAWGREGALTQINVTLGVFLRF